MQELNMCGKQCPIPVIETKKVLEQAKQGEIVVVLVDNEIAVQNLQRLANNRQDKAEVKKLHDDKFAVEIMVSAAGRADTIDTAKAAGDAEAVGFRDADTEKTGQQELSMLSVRKSELVVVISSDHMGEPDVKLGSLLMKSFIFALSKQDKLPAAILFYNGGACLTTEESESLGDLKMMEGEGVEILTCGMCLQYLGLEDKLGVGTVTNMYDIVERMTSADQIIRP